MSRPGTPSRTATSTSTTSLPTEESPSIVSSTTTATKINTKSHFPEESRSDLQEPPLQYCCESPAHAPRPALLSMLPSYPHAHSLVLSPCSGDTPQGLTVDDDDDFPHGDGEEAASAYDSIPLILTSVAGVLQPSDPSQAYVFCGNRYVTIKVIPGTMDDITARGSKTLRYPFQTMGNNCIARENYAVINADPGPPNDCVIDGPKNIIGEWASLKSAGFNTIDAVLPNPVNSEQAYFFRGEQYVLIHVQQGPNKDYIVDGPKPIWPCLKDAGFKEITMMLPNPSNSTEAYVFSREEYALISIGRDASDKYIVDGPKAIHTGWPLLRQVCFM